MCVISMQIMIVLWASRRLMSLPLHKLRGLRPRVRPQEQQRVRRYRVWAVMPLVHVAAGKSTNTATAGWPNRSGSNWGWALDGWWGTGRRTHDARLWPAWAGHNKYPPKQAKARDDRGLGIVHLPLLR